MEVKISSAYGFCEGVKNALKIVEKTRIAYPDKQIFLLNKIVHNEAVINELKEKGIKILDDSRSLKDKINSIPENSVIIFSAHGHDQKLDEIAKHRNLIYVDAACPKVLVNLKSIVKSLNDDKDVIYIGIENHPETNAALSLDDKIIFIDFKNPSINHINNLNVVSIHNQTTLIQTELNKIYKLIEKKAKKIEIVNDICFATLHRQNALDEVTDEDLIIIIGDQISSNSTRLYEVAKIKFPLKKVYQVSSLDEVKKIDLSLHKKGFITAGASTPDSVINPIIKYISSI